MKWLPLQRSRVYYPLHFLRTSVRQLKSLYQVRDCSSLLPGYMTKAMYTPVPVELLYYSPFASFAPSFDSSAATISYSRSLPVIASQQKLEQFEAAEAQLFKSIEASPGPVPVVDPIAPTTLSMEMQLAKNAQRISLLQRGQYERLRQHTQKDGKSLEQNCLSLAETQAGTWLVLCPLLQHKV